MNALCLTRYSKWASVGLLLSVIASASPVRAATFGFIPVGLGSVDDYEQVYATNGVQGGISNPIGEYHSSVTDAVNENTPGIDTPLEQALVAAGYNPTILQEVVSRALRRVAGLSAAVSDNAGLSAFQFDAKQISYLINDAELSPLMDDTEVSSLSGWESDSRSSSLIKDIEEISLPGWKNDSLLSALTNDIKAISLPGWKNDRRCQKIRARLLKDPNSVSLEKQATCWSQ
ncbi:MAG: hypothetical protein O2890_02820 [Cyanobacteria bacterium]|nr:hypothetical protein [Cyanobacteriota bacterium]MDA0865348.1 hypothetical protein [Cyanobacteriota bacterium]